MNTISRNDWNDLIHVQDVVSELEESASDDRAERLARAAWQALTNLNAYISGTPTDESVGEHIWNAEQGGVRSDG